MATSRGNNHAEGFDFPSTPGADWQKNDSERNNRDQLVHDSEEIPMPRLGEGDYFLTPRSTTHDQSRFGEGDYVSNSNVGQAQGLHIGTFAENSRGITNDTVASGDTDCGRNVPTKTSRRETSNDQPKPNLIVNYLPQHLTDNDFFNLFGPFGPLESIKIMRDPQTGYSFGYGFVNYADLDDAVDARCELNGLQLGHKKIKVSFARPPSDDIKDTNLFVTGLPPNVTEKDLEVLFSPFGVIVHLRVLRDRYTKETRGVAFVRYETRSQACEAILKMNGVMPTGNKDPIRVRLAQDHGKQKAAYLAGYQAALTVKKALGCGGGPESSRFCQDNVYGLTGPRNEIPSRARPATSSAVSNQSASMYWKGFMEASERLPRTSRLGNMDHYPSSRR